MRSPNYPGGTVATKKAVADDKVFAKAKKKISDALDAVDSKDIGGLTSLVNSLTKIKMVELKTDGEEWGDGLTGGDA